MPMSKVMNQLTVTVKITGVRRWRVRLWIATGLLRIAAWLVGGNWQVTRDE